MNDSTNNPSLNNNHIVAVIHGEGSAQQAMQELQTAGYTDAQLLTGEEGANQIDARGENSHIFARLFGAIEDHLSEATNYMKQYEEEARDGKVVVAVEVPSRDEAEGAREVLVRNGAQNIRFFGKLAVTDLSPESNPSLRAESSPEKQEAT